VGEDLDLAHAAWAFAHGMTNLKLNGRFPPDADLAGAWERGVQAFSSNPPAAITARGERSRRRR
jgi:Tetracyclin repressor-like, C-terminal domain